MINKERFLRYEKVRLSGKYNMITDANNARVKAGLTLEEYFEIIKNYSTYRKKYMEE